MFLAERSPTAMKQLVRKPFFLALLLSIPLWIAFNNYIVAITVALLVAYLLSMCHSLYVLTRAKSEPKVDSPKPPESP